MDNKIKFLEMIENVISRMSSNSFKLKGWAISLVSIVTALSNKCSWKVIVILGLIPLFAFWFLDSYYLMIERKFRILYNHNRIKTNDKIDFDMRLSEINYSDRDLKKVCYCRCLFSITEGGLYIPVIVAFCVVLYFFYS